MSARHVVVDGSNIATEGRSLPSLAQLEEAVREYSREFPDDLMTVVVDATFGHRIDESERATYDEAVAHNEVVCPPAGAIGRGDAFLLRVADKVGATVLSNDSFQEFHGEHPWLFDNGRLIGGKPVPGVGWVFTARTPVRGPKSRDAVRAVKVAARKATPEKRQQRQEKQKVQKAIAVATEEAVEPDSPTVKRRRRARGGSPPAEPVNEPLPFIEFVAAHPLGTTVEGDVDEFSSHGAFVKVGDTRCYVPLSAMGNPPPRAAREVLKRAERRAFVVQAFDPPRRGIELALPEFAHVSGEPRPETVEDEIEQGVARRVPADVVADRRAPRTGKTRVYELARELGRTNAEVLDLCRTLGIGVRSHSSSLDDADADRVRSEVRRAASSAPAATDGAGPAQPATRKRAPGRRGATRKAVGEEPAPGPPASEGTAREGTRKKAPTVTERTAKAAKPAAKGVKAAKAGKAAKVAKPKKVVGSV